MPDIDIEALRAALKPDDALVVGKYTLHGTDNGTAHFTYLNDVGKPRGLWTAAGALIPAQTILALLSRLTAAEAENADLRAELKALNEGAAHNAAIDRDEIQYWKDRAHVP